MSELPTFTFSATANSPTTSLWRVTPGHAANVSAENDPTAGSDMLAERTKVQISQEALDTFQAYTEAAKTGSTASSSLSLSEGVKLHAPDALSEQDQQALIASLHRDPVAVAKEALETQGQAMKAANLQLSAISTTIEQTYTRLLETIASAHPDLKGAAFGFSVDAAGALVLTNASSLSADQRDRLLRTLNASDDLVKQANDLADAQIALFEVERFSLGRDFNRANYPQTIDIGAELLARVAARNAPRDGPAAGLHPLNLANNWRQQLWAKGEHKPMSERV
ncbi:hypothetical protein K5Q02_20890 [Pseudomonas sp. MM211]|uniref:hypothetical protein n=1 Tax=Pseudomonas sp. MM211 TaxID=2866808 RepID=UPI001CEC79FC|nr:hypothetical protein [Pseudomonas sp. MM211]UCJ16235.1 hypothetical protein K5Q02_20890 [Pseudomonas sp. MM211]